MKMNEITNIKLLNCIDSNHNDENHIIEEFRCYQNKNSKHKSFVSYCVVTDFILGRVTVDEDISIIKKLINDVIILLRSEFSFRINPEIFIKLWELKTNIHNNKLEELKKNLKDLISLINEITKGLCLNKNCAFAHILFLELNKYDPLIFNYNPMIFESMCSRGGKEIFHKYKFKKSNNSFINELSSEFQL